MATVFLCPLSAIFQYFNDVGIVLAGGKINTYLAGTSTPQVTYTDQTGTVPNANPLVLAANGRLNNVQIWQSVGVKLKIIITDANNNILGPTFDQIPGINDTTYSLGQLSSATSGSGADLVANAMRSYDIVASVRAANVPSLSAGQTLVIYVEGGTAVNDGLGGIFYWSASSVATDDGLNVIQPTALATGRYLRGFGTGTGSFTATLTGMTGATTGTMTWRRDGSLVTLYATANILGTSNSTGMTMTGVPAAILPALSMFAPCSGVTDNSNNDLAARVVTSGSGTFTFQIAKTGVIAGFVNYVSSSFTNSGLKGISQGWTMTYSVQ